MKRTNRLPAQTGERASEIVARLGPHPSRRMGLELDAGGDEALGRWLVATCLLASRGAEERALAAQRALSAANLARPAEIAAAGPVAVEAVLKQAAFSKAEPAALVLARASRALCEGYAGSLTALAEHADGLEELGGRLASLARGLGPAAINRFLQPLRERWPAAQDLSLDPAAHAAARHLGLIPEDLDAEGSPAVLRSRLDPEGPELHDLEAALARLGRRACLRERRSRCPLPADCPLWTDAD